MTLASGYVHQLLAPLLVRLKYPDSQTDPDGRCANLLPSGSRLQPGVYKMIFNTGEYFEQDKRDTFYPVVEVCLSAAKIRCSIQHYISNRLFSTLPNQTNTITSRSYLAPGPIQHTVVARPVSKHVSKYCACFATWLPISCQPLVHELNNLKYPSFCGAVSQELYPRSLSR